MDSLRTCSGVRDAIDNLVCKIMLQQFPLIDGLEVPWETFGLDRVLLGDDLLDALW